MNDQAKEPAAVTPSPGKSNPRTMKSISDDDVRRVAGFCVGGQELTPAQRLEIFSCYWQDALSREPLTGADRLELLALFIHWGCRKPTSRDGRQASRGGAIATYWRNRLDQPLSGTLHGREIRQATQLLEDAQRSGALPVATVPHSDTPARQMAQEKPVEKSPVPDRPADPPAKLLQDKPAFADTEFGRRYQKRQALRQGLAVSEPTN